MQLSPTVQRLKPSATIAAAAKARELKSTGVTVHEFTLGEPDYVTPAHICDRDGCGASSGFAAQMSKTANQFAGFAIAALDGLRARKNNRLSEQPPLPSAHHTIQLGTVPK